MGRSLTKTDQNRKEDNILDYNYQNGLLYHILRSHQQEFLNEAEHIRLVRQAKQKQQDAGVTLKLRKVLGYSLIKLGQRVSPELREA